MLERRGAVEILGGPPSTIEQGQASPLVYRLKLPPRTRFSAWVLRPAGAEPAPVRFSLSLESDDGEPIGGWSRVLGPSDRDQATAFRVRLTESRSVAARLTLETRGLDDPGDPMPQSLWVEPTLLLGGSSALRPA
ncbi:MAG: hypothetical protein ACRDLO_01690, partial [Solirubrobacterales bacterium]